MIYILLAFVLLSLLIFLKFFFNPQSGDLKVINRLSLDHKHSIVSVIWKNKEYLLLLSANSSSVIDVSVCDKLTPTQKFSNSFSNQETSTEAKGRL